MYFTMSFIPVMQSRTFSSQYFSVIYDSSEIIAICRFGAQETFLIINVEKWSSNWCSFFFFFRLKLRYEGVKEGPSFCNGHSPAVTITFICPSARQAVRRCLVFHLITAYLLYSVISQFSQWFIREVTLRWSATWTVGMRLSGWLSTPATEITWRVTTAHWPANSTTSPLTLLTWHTPVS